MNFDADFSEGEDFLKALAADLHVDFDINSSVIKLEGRNSLIGETEKPFMGS